MKKILKEA